MFVGFVVDEIWEEFLIIFPWNLESIFNLIRMNESIEFETNSNSLHERNFALSISVQAPMSVKFLVQFWCFQH